MSQSLSKQIERLVDIGQKDYGQAQDVKLFTRMMLQTVIPRKQTEKKEIIIRNGHWQIGIQSGIGEKLPSGSLPRLILILTIALAIEHNSRTVPLGSCLAEFMDWLGIKEKTGGRWGTITRVKTAARQLFKSRVSVEYTGPKGYAFESIQFADKVRAYWTISNYNQPDLEGHVVVLHELFYDYIKQNPFPLDFDILKSLARSPLGIDLYVWLSYRMFNLKEPAGISWKQLHVQMGGTYGSTDDFVKNTKRELKKINLAWSGLRYDTPRGRLILHPSPLSVPATNPRKQIIAKISGKNSG